MRVGQMLLGTRQGLDTRIPPGPQSRLGDPKALGVGVPVLKGSPGPLEVKLLDQWVCTAHGRGRFATGLSRCFQKVSRAAFT